MTRHRLITPKHNLPGPWDDEPTERPTPRTAEFCAYGGPVAYEVRCRVCSRETALRPVYFCSLYGGAMARRNEHAFADCSRCPAFAPT